MTPYVVTAVVVAALLAGGVIALDLWERRREAQSALRP